MVHICFAIHADGSSNPSNTHDILPTSINPALDGRDRAVFVRKNLWARERTLRRCWRDLVH